MGEFAGTARRSLKKGIKCWTQKVQADRGFGRRKGCGTAQFSASYSEGGVYIALRKKRGGKWGNWALGLIVAEKRLIPA